MPLRDLSAGEQRRGEGSRAIRERVERARAIQRQRYASLGGAVYNGRASGRWLDRNATVEASARELLIMAAERLQLSARSYHRVLRVAQSIADLDDSAAILQRHVSEALRFRPV